VNLQKSTLKLAFLDCQEMNESQNSGGLIKENQLKYELKFGEMLF